MQSLDWPWSMVQYGKSQLLKLFTIENWLYHQVSCLTKFLYKISIQIKKTLIQWFVWSKLCGYQWPSHGVHPWTTNEQARGFVAKPCPESWNQSVFVFLGKIPRVLNRGFANGLPSGWSAVIHNAWFNLTCYHAPSPGHTPWDLQFFSLFMVYSPSPDMQKESIPYCWAPNQPRIQFLEYIFWEQYWFPYNGKTWRF